MSMPVVGDPNDHIGVAYDFSEPILFSKQLKKVADQGLEGKRQAFSSSR